MGSIVDSLRMGRWWPIVMLVVGGAVALAAGLLLIIELREESDLSAVVGAGVLGVVGASYFLAAGTAAMTYCALLEGRALNEMKVDTSDECISANVVQQSLRKLSKLGVFVAISLVIAGLAVMVVLQQRRFAEELIVILGSMLWLAAIPWRMIADHAGWLSELLMAKRRSPGEL